MIEDTSSLECLSSSQTDSVFSPESVCISFPKDLDVLKEVAVNHGEQLSNWGCGL